MKTRQQIEAVIDRVAEFLGSIINGREHFNSIPAGDDLYAEINRLKKDLANAPTRPTRVRDVRSLEPVSDRQKIMDLAG